VSWSLADETFDYGTEYTATITLTAKSGYTLTGVEANFFTVAGADTVTNAADSGVVTAVFPATYSIGDIGPSGGYVFYENPNYIADGWRYLEAAPADVVVVLDEPNYSHIFGYYRVEGATTEVGTATGIGTGKTNTDTLVAAMGDAAYTSNMTSTTTMTGEYAARLCDIHEAGGFSDWFLPSKDELNLMYQNLLVQDLGGFSDKYYWSSSETNANGAWSQSFYYSVYGSSPGVSGRYEGFRVRPVRAF
jgi:hypothetical protein